jgi:hypothetical protein
MVGMGSHWIYFSGCDWLELQGRQVQSMVPESMFSAMFMICWSLQPGNPHSSVPVRKTLIVFRNGGNRFHFLISHQIETIWTYHQWFKPGSSSKGQAVRAASSTRSGTGAGRWERKETRWCWDCCWWIDSFCAKCWTESKRKRLRIRWLASGSPPKRRLKLVLENAYFYITNILQLHEWIQCKYNPKGVHQVYTFLPRLYIP